jgi:hypothetical protein
MTAPVVIPVTGEVLDLSTVTTTDVVDAVERVAGYLDELAAVRQALIDEVARRLDAAGSRSAEVAGVRLETNAPTEEVYDVDRLLEALRPLVAAGVLEETAVRELVVRPIPKIPAPRVDKRRLNVLRRSANPRLIEALDAARSVIPTRRTLKIERKDPRS